MERAWQVDFSCGMYGCDSDSFINDIMPTMTKDELLFILNEISSLCENMKDEYKKRYADG